jgi:rod shape determining protein RodA
MKNLGGAVANYFRRTDKWLLLLWVGASGLAVMFLWGLYYRQIIPGDPLPDAIDTQIKASLLGLGVALVTSLIDYRFILKLWKLYTPLCVGLVLLTFTALGSNRGGDQAWLLIPIGPFEQSIQPSELLKISFICTMTVHLCKVREHLNRLTTVLLLCLHGGAHILLIQQQGDDGRALIFIGIFAAMLFVAGINWRYVIAAGAALVGVLPLLWFRVMSEDQKARVLVLFDPAYNPDVAQHQIRAANALGLGGVQGAGIFQTDHYYVYEAYNDFIFSFIGQSAGFVGCIGVLALLALICFKILWNSQIAADFEGRYLCVGVFAMLLTQIFINVGMCIGLLPVIGVTLPLFSAGGTSVLTLYLGLGLVLSVYAHREAPLY